MKVNNMTAVEWLKEKVKETYDKEGKLPLGYILNLLSQAKAMECEQIMQAHLSGLLHPLEMEATKQAEQYCNETYGKDSN
jgi:hypothetical protein